MSNKSKKELGDSSFFTQTPEKSLENLRPDRRQSKDNSFDAMDLKLNSNFKIHGGQRAHKITPKDNIGLDFLGQENNKVSYVLNMNSFMQTTKFI